MDEESIDILIEILKIYKRYGSEAMKKAMDTIRNKDIMPEIVDIIEEIPKLNNMLLNHIPQKYASKSMVPQMNRSLGVSRKKTNSRRISISKELDKIRETSPLEYEVLQQIHSKLLSGELLPTIANVRDFAIEHGISETENIGKDRRSAVRSLMLFLIKSRIGKEDLNKILGELVKFSSNLDSSILQRWANIIMRDSWKGVDDKKKEK